MNLKKSQAKMLGFFYLKSFSLIELIFVISIIAIISTYSISTTSINKLKLAKNQIKMHLKYMRYISLLDNKYEHNNELWFRKAWNLKFRKCNNTNDIHYYIYNDKDNNGHVKQSETLKDPLTNQYIYSSTHCIDSTKRTNYTLLSKYYNVKNIDISCNETTSFGQILFLNNAEAYSKFENNINNMDKYKIKNDCIINLYDENNNKESITIQANTGYIY